MPKTHGDGEAPTDNLIDRDHGLQYWEAVSPDVNSMLGGVPAVAGFSHITKVDLQGSRNFLAKLGIGTKSGQRIVESAVDGGAGIGRITRGLLLDVARQVDVVEPVAKLTAGLHGIAGIRYISNVGLEDWNPADGVVYDLIWTQWCVGHLNDGELVRYLERCKAVLRPQDGVIVLKENLSTSGRDIFDESDSSITREDGKFQALFKLAGLRIVRTELQRGLPTSPGRKLFPVRMYALKPELAPPAIKQTLS